jgi:hypothetical protein
MADTVAITAGAGTTINTDEVGGVHTQRTKVTWGVDGTVTDASATNPLPVTAPAATRATHSIAVANQTEVIMASLTALTVKFFSETVAPSDTDEELVAAVTARKLRVISLAVHCGATATDITFESGTTTRIHKIPAGANGGQVLPANQWGWFETASGSSLTCTTGAGANVEISGTYIEIP